MVAWFRQWRRSFLLSLVCHVVLLAFFYKAIFMHPVGVHDVVIEHVYLFQSKHNKPNMPAHIQQEIKQQSLVMQPKKEESVRRRVKRMVVQVAMKSSVHAAHMPKQEVTGGMKSLLLEQLHDDMSRHLIYPDSAVSLDLSGIVTLQFLMLPSGAISQVSVVRSSGSPILDHAACLTLHAISPFTPAKQYLHKPSTFMIPVAFEMQS